jgi:hypothetical protein
VSAAVAAPPTVVAQAPAQALPPNRLSDPRFPLSVDEDRDYRTVRSVVYFLRVARKKESVRLVSRVLQAADTGLRWSDIAAYLQRLVALERLTNQCGQHSGNTSATGRTYDGNSFEHDGQHSFYRVGNGPGNENRVSSLTENVNINDGKTDAKPRLKEPTDGERRVLEVCYQWERGISIPMPADLKPLLDTMRLTMDLPRRPGV